MIVVTVIVGIGIFYIISMLISEPMPEATNEIYLAIYLTIACSIIFILIVLFYVCNIGFYIFGETFKTSLTKKRYFLVYLQGLIICGFAIFMIITTIK